MIIFIVSEVLEAVQNHDYAPLAVSPTSTITLAMLLWLSRVTHLGADGIADQVEAARKVDTQLIIYDVDKTCLHIGELLSELHQGSMNEGLILSFTGGCTCNVY